MWLRNAWHDVKCTCNRVAKWSLCSWRHPLQREESTLLKVPLRKTLTLQRILISDLGYKTRSGWFMILIPSIISPCSGLTQMPHNANLAQAHKRVKVGRFSPKYKLCRCHLSSSTPTTCTCSFSIYWTGRTGLPLQPSKHGYVLTDTPGYSLEMVTRTCHTVSCVSL